LKAWKITEISFRIKKCRIAFHMYNSAALSPFPEKMQSNLKTDPDKKNVVETPVNIIFL
jgi:hypothetical protein